mmetsp:Transcript_817/g.2929  ORF Transcript_817/g.2929 Transcript_817/m.2929 type:complete len:310 (-) Transcript_817:1848-2777(-)
MQHRGDLEVPAAPSRGLHHRGENIHLGVPAERPRPVILRVAAAVARANSERVHHPRHPSKLHRLSGGRIELVASAERARPWEAGGPDLGPPRHWGRGKYQEERPRLPPPEGTEHLLGLLRHDVPTVIPRARDCEVEQVRPIPPIHHVHPVHWDFIIAIALQHNEGVYPPPSSRRQAVPVPRLDQQHHRLICSERPKALPPLEGFNGRLGCVLGPRLRPDADHEGAVLNLDAVEGDLHSVVALGLPKEIHLVRPVAVGGEPAHSVPRALQFHDERIHDRPHLSVAELIAGDEGEPVGGPLDGLVSGAAVQ